jgi:hypothetical protein
LDNKNHSTSVLILSYDDVQSLFGSLQPDSNDWLSCPIQWHDKSTPLKIGGILSNIKLRLVVNIQEVNAQLPVVMSSIRGTIDPDHFIMIGYKLGSTQQNRIINEIIQAYTNQIKNGWNPKFVLLRQFLLESFFYFLFCRRSVLFSAWSGLDYDYYTSKNKNY